jgi:hypothetical protein
MVLALITFFAGLAISAVAIYYSVIGLAAIFAAAVIPIIIMGTILEVSKLVAAWWLKANWHRAPFLLKSYMLVAVVVLMLITSMGIFGFLSKAHTEQAVPVGDNQAKIQIIDERIAIEQEVIEQARRDLTILNQQVERFSELGAVTRGVNARNQQREERDALNAQISEAQTKISELRTERAPFAASLRAIEAEVGPIKYIAKLIYGDATDANMLEQAVVWIIIVIVFVFDPLAVLLLLASQMSFRWAKEERELRSEQNAMVPIVDDTTQDSDVKPISNDDVEPTVEPVDSQPEPEVTKPVEEKLRVDPHPPGWAFSNPIANTVEVSEEVIEEDDEDDEDVPNHIKVAKTCWKKDHPNDSLKHQRTMLEQGLIEELPWMLPPYNLEAVDDAVIEAARWAQEQIDESKKKDSDLDGETGNNADNQEQRGIAGYQQNAEQSESTIWKRIKEAKQ